MGGHVKKSSSIRFAAFALASLSALAFVSSAEVASAVERGQRFQFKGENAWTSFSSVDASGCVVTDVHIWAGESVTREGGTRTARTEAYANVSKVDQCNGWNVLLSGSGPASSVQLDINRTGSASLEASFSIFDYMSETSSVLTVDLTWTGVGEVSRGHSSSHDRFPGGSSRYHSNGSYRNAEVSGSVRSSLYPGVELAPSSGSGQLSMSNSGSFYSGPTYPIER
jgi:hypothetical protein